VTNCTIAGNSGSGIDNVGTLTVSNSTIVGNSGVNGFAGGIVNERIGTLYVGTCTLSNTIIARDQGGDVSGTFISLGHNLIGNADGSSGWAASDLTGTGAGPLDARLGPLQDNGGPTQTMAPRFGSPAIAAGDNANGGLPLPATDQRGRDRVANGTIDIGAFETQPSSLQAAVAAIWTGTAGSTELDYAVDQATIGGYLAAVADLTPGPAAGPTMALAPVEVMAPERLVSYVPSGSVYARLHKGHRPLSGTSLLALGDPTFSAPAHRPPEPPSHGLLVRSVVPLGNAAGAGLRAGDVLLEYDGTVLRSPADLKPRAAGGRVRARLWREGEERVVRLNGGRLDADFDPRPANEALPERERLDRPLVSRGPAYQPLPGTRLEVRTLTRLVEDSTPLLGSSASEQALEQLALSGKLKCYRLVHLATHGEVDDSRPLNTGVVLAKDRLPARLTDKVQEILSGKKPRDGRLDVETILRDWTLDADLVTLSACRTGLGKDGRGEGMLGFAQALLQKGARSVVLSRWKVDDAATALLMARFYENLLGRRDGLKSGLPRAEALAEAKRWLRGLTREEVRARLAGLTAGLPRGERGTVRPGLPEREGDAAKGDRPYEHPYYWAAFVLIGDPR
jgi:hypothetical protein